jgi:NaMN:DMB phosphoribosyltransferase
MNSTGKFSKYAARRKAISRAGKPPGSLGKLENIAVRIAGIERQMQK